MMDVPAVLARSLLATASDAIVATDRDGVIRFWNKGAVRIFARRPWIASSRFRGS
jgi:PAS domain-containing protein